MKHIFQYKKNREERRAMSQVDNVTILKQVLRSVVDIIGRRSSEHYAVVMVGTVIRNLSKSYPLISQISIKSTQFTESSQLITVPSSVNSLTATEFHDILEKILAEITSSIGKTAGNFFLKELKETIGSSYDTALVNIGIDLGFLQFQQLAEKRQKPVQVSDPLTVLKHTLQVLLNILTKETSMDLSFSTITFYLQELRPSYPFLKSITIKDIRYTQTDEIVLVPVDINSVDQSQVGAAIQDILVHLQKWLEQKDIYSLIQTFISCLKEEDRLALEAMGVNFNAVQISHEAVFKHVLKALLTTLGKASTPQYAVFALDSIIKKLGDTYEYLNYIKIDSTRYTDGIDAVSVMGAIDNLKPTDAGRGIQKLMEETIKTLGSELGPQFVEELKTHLGKIYLTRLEDLGVNLHIIQLRQDLFSLKQSKF